MLKCLNTDPTVSVSQSHMCRIAAACIAVVMCCMKVPLSLTLTRVEMIRKRREREGEIFHSAASNFEQRRQQKASRIPHAQPSEMGDKQNHGWMDGWMDGWMLASFS